MTQPNNILQCDQLTKDYGNHLALKDCSLSVKQGEVFGLLGPNGAGKTTLIRLLLGFLKPTSGTAKIKQLDCYTQSVEVHRHVSYLPGEVRFYIQKRARDIIQLFGKLRQTVNLSRAYEFAERLDLDLSRRVAFMSTGMRQKLGLVITFAAEADIYILDEPTSNLDPSVRSEVLAIVTQAQQAGRTIIFSSHVLSEVEDVSDRVAILRTGKLVHTQVIQDLRGQHRIIAKIKTSLPQLPASLAASVSIEQDTNQVVIHTNGDLSPLLPWLNEAGLSDVSIQRVGLRSIYDEQQLDKKATHLIS